MIEQHLLELIQLDEEIQILPSLRAHLPGVHFNRVQPLPASFQPSQLGQPSWIQIQVETNPTTILLCARSEVTHQAEWQKPLRTAVSQAITCRPTPCQSPKPNHLTLHHAMYLPRISHSTTTNASRQCLHYARSLLRESLCMLQARFMLLVQFLLHLFSMVNLNKTLSSSMRVMPA